MPRVLLTLILCAASMSGCELIGRKTIFVPQGAPVRLAEPIKGAKVWIKEGDGRVYQARKDLPAGWFVAPLQEVAPK